jgi:hypothetical protein
MGEVLRCEGNDSFAKLNEDLVRSAGQTGNRYKQAFSLDLLDLLENNQNVNNRIREVLSYREEIDKTLGRSPVTASYAGHLALYAVHSRIIESERVGYPYDHASPGSWKEDIIDSVLDNGEGNRLSNFKFDVSIRDAMSNIPSRYYPVKLLSAKLAGRINRPLRFLDVGASRLHGGKMIAGQEKFIHPTIEGIERSEYQQLGQSVIEVGRVVGVDQWGIDNDIATSIWAKACSLPPHEIQDPDRVDQYDYLEKLKLPNVDLRLGIIGTDQFLQYHGDLRGNTEVLLMCTVTYQMNQKKLDYSISQAKECLTEDGIMIIQDHIVLDGGGRKCSVNNWQDEKSYPYRTYVYDNRFAKHGWTETFRWTNGRCVEGIISGKEGLRALNRLEI